MTVAEKKLAVSSASTRILCREQFGLLLNERNLLGQAVEIGCYRGDFTISLLANWKGRMLHAVDPWISYGDYERDCLNNVNLEQAYQDYLERTRMFNRRIQVHRMTSRDAASLFQPGSLDYFYLDGNHTYPYVCQDLRLYWPLLRSGGVASGHDFDAAGSWKDDVRPAVLEFFGDLNLPVSYVIGDAHSWYVCKP